MHKRSDISLWLFGKVVVSFTISTERLMCNFNGEINFERTEPTAAVVDFMLFRGEIAGFLLLAFFLVLREDEIWQGLVVVLDLLKGLFGRGPQVDVTDKIAQGGTFSQGRISNLKNESLFI